VFPSSDWICQKPLPESENVSFLSIADGVGLGGAITNDPHFGHLILTGLLLPLYRKRTLQAWHVISFKNSFS
jgi:hypothetical protein